MSRLHSTASALARVLRNPLPGATRISSRLAHSSARLSHLQTPASSSSPPSQSLSVTHPRSGSNSSWSPFPSSHDSVSPGPRHYASAHSERNSVAQPEWLTHVPVSKTSRLPNNIQVVTEEGDGETATVGVFVNAGSVYENDKNNGVAHFLEHMAFKGTGTRGQRDIEIQVENAGASLNAFTSREQTAYIAHAQSAQVPGMLEILSDIIQNSEMSNSAVQNERRVILTELSEVNARSEEYIFDLLHSACFQGTPLGYTILGPEENINSLQRKDLREYIKTYYTGDRMTVVGAGGVKHEDMVRLAQKLFTKVEPVSPFPMENYPDSLFTGTMVSVPDSTMPVAHIVIGMEGLPAAHPDSTALTILQDLIGMWAIQFGEGRTSSKLCEKVAQKKLGQSVQYFNSVYRNTGVCGVYTIANPPHVTALCKEVFKHFHRLSSEATDEMVERGKNKLKAMVLLGVDGTTPTCEDIGRQMLMYGRRIPASEIFMRIDAVTGDDVRRVAEDIFTRQPPAIAAMGALDDLPDYDRFLEWSNGNF